MPERWSGGGACGRICHPLPGGSGPRSTGNTTGLPEELNRRLQGEAGKTPARSVSGNAVLGLSQRRMRWRVPQRERRKAGAPPPYPPPQKERGRAAAQRTSGANCARLLARRPWLACAFRRSASLFDPGANIFWSVVVSKARAHESAARTILFVCAQLDSFTSAARGRGRERSERVRGRCRCAAPSGNAPSSRPSPRTRGEGVRSAARRVAARTPSFISPQCAPPRARLAGQDGRYHATKTERAGVAVSAADDVQAMERAAVSRAARLSGAGAMHAAGILARLRQRTLPPRAALPRSAAVSLGAQAGDAAGRMGEGGSGLPAAACAVVARLPQRLGRPVAVLSVPHPPPRAARGRGTARSAVEGACGGEASLEARAPSTALRAVPLPRFAGQDGGLTASLFATRDSLLAIRHSRAGARRGERRCVA